MINKKINRFTKRTVKKKKQYVAIQLLIILLLSGSAFFLIHNRNLSGFTIYEAQPDPDAGKDTYMREGSASPFNTSTTLKIGKSAGNQEFKALLEFNISPVPAGNSIDSAVLQVYVASSAITNSTTITLHRLTSSWTEDYATWDYKDNGIPWFTAGGDYDSTTIDSQLFTNETKWYNFTITSLVRNWHNGTYSNLGLVLIATSPPAGDTKEIFSSDYVTDTTLRPKITVSYAASLPPTISAISTDSSLTSPKRVGTGVTFSVTWSDIDSTQANIFVCNSSAITVSGCTSGTLCNTSLSSSSPQTCTYTVQEINNRTSQFWTAACDSSNCSSVNQSNFFANHIPTVAITQPNGGETINQSASGNYSIQFTIADSDTDRMTANLYYGSTANSTEFSINTALNLTAACSDPDHNTSTTNACSYSWDTSGLQGAYFFTIMVNDSFDNNTKSSASSFTVASLVDTTPPNLTAQWLSNLSAYSGKVVSVYTNISDPSIDLVWAALNTTPQQNITLFNASRGTYNGTFPAGVVGNYTIKVYAKDLIGNLNDSLPWMSFNVTRPNAAAQNLVTPTSASPLALIKVTADFNATDPVVQSSAFLSAPGGSTFLASYPQNTTGQNYSSELTNTTTWFFSTPSTEANYTFNVTFTDKYSNTWTSSNAYTASNYSSAQTQNSYLASISGYPEVETSGPYFAQASFTNSGVLEQADSATISIYDATGSLTVGPASMTNPSTGKYNYSYTVGSSVTEGQWETRVNVTKSSVSYSANQFWKVVGGPFDVRSITIDNSAIDSLEISVTTENTGGATKDLTLNWNLSREDNGTLLDSGSDTFAVTANSIRVWTINPTTSYVGQVRITFLGHYSGTERAGAFRTFSTTAAGTTPAPSTSTGGGGGGGGGTTTKTENETGTSLASIIAETEITLAKNIAKTVQVKIQNKGKSSLKNVKLNLEGLSEEYYTLTPESISSIKAGESGEFSLTFLISDFMGEKPFVYKMTSDTASASLPAIINVVATKDYFLQEIKRLRNKLALLSGTLTGEELLKRLTLCTINLDTLDSLIEEEQYLEVRDKIKEMDNCMNTLSKEAGQKPSKPLFSPIVSLKGYGAWIFTWILLISVVAVLIIITRVLYTKMSIINFFKGEEQTVPRDSRSTKDEMFEEKLSDIEKKLRGG